MGYKDGSRQRGGKAYRQNQSLKESLRERCNYTCQLCGRSGKTIDHIIPWAVSHDSTLANLRVLCTTCNLKLRRVRRDANPHKTMADYYAYLEHEIVAEMGIVRTAWGRASLFTSEMEERA